MNWYKGKYVSQKLRFTIPVRDYGRAIVNNSIDLVIPPICNLCRCDLNAENRWFGLCTACCELATMSNDCYCTQCGHQRDTHKQELTSIDSGSCSKCKQKKYMFSHVFTLGPYHNHLRNAVLQTKHPYGYPLAVSLGRLLAHARKKEIDLFHPDFIVATPMHWWRQLKKGVNGPDVIANSMAKYLHISKANRVISRCRHSAQQVNLSQNQRLENIKSAFLLLKKNMSGKRILLIDDVMTTGATCNEIARLFRSHGAKDVAVAVVARAEIEST